MILIHQAKETITLHNAKYIKISRLGCTVCFPLNKINKAEMKWNIYMYFEDYVYIILPVGERLA